MPSKPVLQYLEINDTKYGNSYHIQGLRWVLGFLDLLCQSLEFRLYPEGHLVHLYQEYPTHSRKGNHVYCYV